jgi:hypothetical protein
MNMKKLLRKPNRPDFLLLVLSNFNKLTVLPKSYENFVPDGNGQY